VSVISEQLTVLKEMAPFADIISRAGDLYMPSAPPMSPLPTSYFTCWAFFDACAGPANETIGTTVLEVGGAFGIHPELLRLIRQMQDSRMGFYIHHGREGNVSILEDLVTTAVYRQSFRPAIAAKRTKTGYPTANPWGQGTCRFHDAIHRGAAGLWQMVGVLPPYVSDPGFDEYEQ
jgi:hypothetical protein